MSNVIEGNLRVKGTFSAQVVDLPDGTVDDDAVGANAGLSAEKLEHQFAYTYRQRTGSVVATQTEDVVTIHAAGEVIGIDVVCTTAPTGGDKAFTVDVQRGNQSTAFTTLLTGVVTVNSTKADREVVEATLVGSPAIADGDTLRVIVTASGTTGSQGQGLVVTIKTREAAD